MANNKLILRTTLSPYNFPNTDNVKNSVLSWKDVDNNFIYLKGRDIYSATCVDDLITLYKQDGDVVSFSISGSDTFTTGGTLVGDTMYFDTTDELSAYTIDVTHLNDEMWSAGTGTNSVALKNSDGESSGTLSYIEGFQNTASGNYSHAEGSFTIASGGDSHAEGYNTIASGESSHSGGWGYDSTYSIIASGHSSFNHSYRENDTPDVSGTTGDYSAILGGKNNSATGIGVIILGGDGISGTLDYTTYVDNFNINTTPNNDNTLTQILVRDDSTGIIKYKTIDSFTDLNVTGGTYDTDSGIVTFTNNTGGTFEISGFTTGLTDSYTITAYTSGSEIRFDNNIEGSNFYSVDLTPIIDNASDTYWVSGSSGTNSIKTVDSANVSTGDYSVAEGYKVTASGDYSHAEGTKTTASGKASHSEGVSTTASGSYSHSEGASTIASNIYSHAEGTTTRASGSSSHAEGSFTTASGTASHAEGSGTIASGNYSHAGGYNTMANGEYSHSGGKGHSETYQVITSGESSFNHSTTENGFISNASGNYSAILGGKNNNASGEGTIVLGGNDITGTQNYTTYVEKLNLNSSGDTPTSSGDTGEIGSVRWDNDFVYLKTGAGWGRIPLDYGF